MFSKLIEWLKEALKKMVGYKSVSDTINDVQIYSISEDMRNAINTWKDVYKDEAPWLDEETGIYSLGLGKEICQSLQQQVLSEMKSTISEPGKSIPTDDSTAEENINTRATFLNSQYQRRLLAKLPAKLEQGMAVGGFIIKPYVVNSQIYFDFCRQGDFVPIVFDDDDNITDIAFFDQFTSGEYRYTKIERQTFDISTKKVVIENKAFKAKIKSVEDEESQDDDLGIEISLAAINKWANISEEPVIIENVEKPLFGFYRVPLANNIDLDSPLGISIFSPAIKLIHRADEQFSRLDWEYDGGQMAIDVDADAVHFSQGYYGSVPQMDKVRDRLYRTLDLGNDDTYKAFTPSLRDTSYLSGLNRYLMRVEDLVGLSRGALSEVESEARTATEMKILKQRAYITIRRNQEALEQALNDAVYAMDVLTTLYELAPDGIYTTTTDWNDSILTDADTELTQKLQLLDANILGKAEVRAWYTGEDEETAEQKIEDIESSSSNAMLNDLFNQTPETTIETNDNPPKPQPEEE